MGHGRALGLGAARQGLVQNGRTYRHEFRTLPDPRRPHDEPFSFIVLGDFGTGIRRPSTATRRQFEVAQALERAVDQFDARLRRVDVVSRRHDQEEQDDGAQVMDNMYLRERLAGEEAAGRAPGPNGRDERLNPADWSAASAESGTPDDGAPVGGMMRGTRCTRFVTLRRPP